MTTLFASFNLPEQMNKALVRMNYAEATPIQAQAIPFAMQGRDILGSAQTGTGKTAAFSIPMIAKLMEDPQAMALVLAPTRELAAQTLDVVHKLTSNNRDIRTALLIGGEPMGKQFAQLRDQPRVIVGTPGRINDHLRRNPNMLKKVIYVALDEADRMLDMGFSEQIDEVFATIPKERQMVMFSATFPESIVKFSRNYLNNPERISVNPESVAVPKIKHEVKRTTDGNKYTDLLAELEARDGSVIIFVKTQHGTDRLAKRLEHDGHESVAIHGGLRQNQRDRAVSAFRAKRYRVMVATDVAARGLDIPHIEHVINYDLPQVAEDYIHRIGRTGRAGAEGQAMAFVLPSDGGKWNAINRILNPGEAPMRGERGERDQGRPNRGGGFKSGGFKSGGYKGRSNDDFRSGKPSWGEKKSFGGPRGGGDFKSDRSDRGSFDRPRGEFKGDRPSYNNDRPRNDFKNDHGSFGDRNGNRSDARPSNDRSFDRPRGEFKGDRPSYNNDRPRNDFKSDRPSFDRPRGEYKGGEFKGGDRDGNRAAPTDRNWNTKEGRPQYKKAEFGGERGGFRSEGRRDGGYQGGNRSERPQGDRPSYNNDRSSAPRGEGRTEGRGFEGKREWKRDDRAAPSGFKKPEGRDAPRGGEYVTANKPKKSKVVAEKKPFKFKEHSRKDARPAGKRAAF
jgi:ATP-dependent RNA helicase DeaD